MIFRRSRPDPTPSRGSARLGALVRGHMPDASDDTQRLVIALAGLCSCVAYADRRYDASEQAHVRAALARVHGLDEAGVAAICEALAAHVEELAASNAQAYTRDLRELGTVEMRREILDALVDLAAADEDLSLVETDLLRRTARAMGLDDDDYVVAQSRHRGRLSVLK
jgi:uncharacterized tellurite resistance protein B-like protein